MNARRRRSPPAVTDKFRRLVWNAVQTLVFQHSPVPLHGLRRAILRAFGARVHRTAIIYPSVNIWAPWNLSMDERACLGPHVICYNVDEVHIGRDATVSQYAHLCTAGHDCHDIAFPLVSASIDVAQGAWIGAEAFINMGVNVGGRAVVGARSVVLKDVPSEMVCAGHPCVPVKSRGTAGDGARRD